MKVTVWAIVVFTVLSDQVAKLLASQGLTQGAAPRAVVEGFFYLTLVHNTGAAFGVFPNQALFFLIVSGLAVITIAIFLRKKPVSLPRDLGFALILGGAVGNLIDRVRLGYVVDFFDFRIWPVFNVADSAITVGALLVIISAFRKKREA